MAAKWCSCLQSCEILCSEGTAEKSTKKKAEPLFSPWRSRARGVNSRHEELLYYKSLISDGRHWGACPFVHQFYHSKGFFRVSLHAGTFPFWRYPAECSDFPKSWTLWALHWVPPPTVFSRKQPREHSRFPGSVACHRIIKPGCLLLNHACIFSLYISLFLQ